MKYKYVIKYMDNRVQESDSFDYDGNINEVYAHIYLEGKTCLSCVIENKYSWIPLHDIRVVQVVLA